ncbi:MAG: hypothetical protein O3A87_02920 [Verrucomicrobia bacterium]|nr:hypothetical protein [Verrucomicrobiota bacterium]MDA1005419.1 hypothetical protein [Verrucomicrobiota bacterium]
MGIAAVLRRKASIISRDFSFQPGVSLEKLCVPPGTGHELMGIPGIGQLLNG